MRPRSPLSNVRGRAASVGPESARRPLAVTMGDPAGIGPDIALAAWARRAEGAASPFAVLGDPGLFADRAEALGMDVPVSVVETPGAAIDVFADALPIIPVSLPRSIATGQPDAASATAVIGAIERAVDLVYAGDASALVTGPINKALLYDAGFHHPGHTEFLGDLARQRGDEATPVMMLACDEFRVVPVTVHMPLGEVPRALTLDLVIHTVTVTARALERYFGLANPRIAVTGLNPHAGEDGALGSEEIETIIPALEQLRGDGLRVTGPHPADAIFQERLRASYDAVVTMYHDQALIPVKAVAFDSAVNVTLGLPFVRTSPDHGTAYDLAGTGRADPSSMIAALRLAAKLSSPLAVDA